MSDRTCSCGALGQYTGMSWNRPNKPGQPGYYLVALACSACDREWNNVFTQEEGRAVRNAGYAIFACRMCNNVGKLKVGEGLAACPLCPAGENVRD